MFNHGAKSQGRRKKMPELQSRQHRLKEVEYYAARFGFQFGIISLVADTQCLLGPAIREENVLISRDGTP